MAKRTMFPILFFIAVTFIVGCSAMQYVPAEYEIERSRIPAFQSAGSVSVENLQPSKKVIKVFDSGAGAESNLNMITEGLVSQLSQEIGKRGSKIVAAGEKTMKVSVSYAKANMGFFTIKSVMRFSVELGDGTTKTFEVANTSPGNLPRTLNGNIARAVIEILTARSILDYLKQP